MWSDRQLNFLLGVNVVALFAGLVLTGQNFISPYNLQSMASQVPELGLLALGVAIAMMAGSGGIDLSGIALANLAGVAAFLFARSVASADNAPGLFSLLFAGTALIVGILGGAVNGLLIARSGLTPIIATLGTQLFFTGLAVVLSNGSALTLGDLPPLDALGNSSVAGLPICFVLFVLVALLLGAALRRTVFGQQLLLLGTNRRAARYAGIAQNRILFITYTVSGVLASLAGIIIAGRNDSAKWDYGSSYVLIAILIAVMAGVRPQGGYGRIVCVVLSATALQLLASLFNFMNISNFFRDMAWGVLLLLFLLSSRIDLRHLSQQSRTKHPA